MRVLFWNINGVAREAAQSKLCDMIREFKPDVFCLAEPKVACSANFRRRLQMEGYSQNVIRNASFSHVANIWICFLDGLVPSVVNRSRQAITIAVEGVHISFIHASYVQVTRRRLWQQLDLQDSVTPWLVMADALGSKFTWANGQSGSHRIISKLDRAVINSAWLAKFENWRYKDLPKEVSDHSTLLGYPFVVPRPKRAPFRVQKMWFLHEDFIRMVSDSWNAPVHGSLDFIFPYKMKRLKVTMKDWNLRVFGIIHSHLKQDQLRFETAARNSDDDPSNIAKLNAMKDAMEILSETRLQHITMLKQKSRNQWLVEGSSTTNFFHNSIRIRRSNNTISELVDANGVTITDYDQLSNHAVQFYEDKFNGQDLDIDDELFNFDHPSISIEESNDMDRIPSPEEIKQVVFELGADSAPGPDGFSGCFYRHCWDIIQDDLIKAIIYCWNTGHIPNGVNSSLIILLA
ncbi:uncharacterized protein LOC113296356 [Papaver somniferum]|uniref:uncharacterized protein LOC113296356 n=1 Tax=Papaver somniferum TaxID=3469 RepID=UPI000E6F5169|nr:uncharacterized protein LOC113296356 [Papaver somniferum]